MTNEQINAEWVIDEALGKLSYREREIIKLRYGIGDGYTYTLEEVGRIFKVTRERVRQVEAKAIRKLKRLLKGSTEDLLLSLKDFGEVVKKGVSHKKCETIVFRLSKELIEKLDRLANKEKVKRSQMLRILIYEAGK